MKQNTFKIPNRLVCDPRLTPMARKIGAVLYAHRNALGMCCKSISELAALSACSPATVRKATEELSDAGYITMRRTYRWLSRKQRMVYGKKAYRCELRFQGGFTLIPRELLRQNHQLTPSAFLVLLYLFVAAGNTRRAFPSISRIERMVGIARSTVCRALHQIKQLREILVQFCRRHNGSLAANSYHFCSVVSNALTSVSAGAELEHSQSAAGVDAQRKGGFLLAIIVKAGKALRNLFRSVGVVPKLANNS